MRDKFKGSIISLFILFIVFTGELFLWIITEDLYNLGFSILALNTMIFVGISIIFRAIRIVRDELKAEIRGIKRGK